jgi:hypothetical protein
MWPAETESSERVLAPAATVKYVETLAIIGDPLSASVRAPEFRPRRA